MNIWIITVGEPLPCDGRNVRLYRTGIMSRLLAARKHEVHWITSNFDHISKEKRAVGKHLKISEGYQIHLLECCRYKKNISIRRLWNHWQLKNSFNKLTQLLPRPDVILCSFPTVELSYASIRYGVKNNVPVVIDVRDLWPDIFALALPKGIQWLGKILFFPYFALTKKVFQHAQSITAVSGEYLKWGLRYADRPLSSTDREFPLAYTSFEKLGRSKLDLSALYRKFGLDENATTILFIGTFGRTYDLRPVIEGLQRSQRKEYPDIQLVLCGDGEFRDKWERLSAELENVVFTGWIGEDELRQLMSIADIGLAAYAIGAPQGIPNKIIEYMAGSLAILSSLDGESRKLIEEDGSGLYYDPKSSGDFMGALDLMLNEKATMQMAANGKQRFDQSFNAESVYWEFEKHLHSLASNKKD